MPSATQAVLASQPRRWARRITSALPALFLLVDGAMKVVQPEPVVKATVELGYAETVMRPLGIMLLTCTILSLIPRTAVLGTRIVKIFELSFPPDVMLLRISALGLVFCPTLTHTQHRY